MNVCLLGFSKIVTFLAVNWMVILQVTTGIYNLIVGKLYIDHFGTMKIQGNGNLVCKLKFKEQTIMDRNPHQVLWILASDICIVLLTYSLNLQSLHFLGSRICLWRKRKQSGYLIREMGWGYVFCHGGHLNKIKNTWSHDRCCFALAAQCSARNLYSLQFDKICNSIEWNNTRFEGMELMPRLFLKAMSQQSTPSPSSTLTTLARG